MTVNKANNVHFLNGLANDKHKYFYICVWSIGCKPCVDEIPYLDKIALNLREDVLCIMASLNSEKAVSNFLKKIDLFPKAFVLLNGLQNFIDEIFKSVDMQTYVFPLHIVLTREGKTLAYLPGAIHNKQTAAPLFNYLQNLPR